MINHGNEIKIFSGNSNRPLAEKIAEHLNTSLGEMEVTHFSDGEIYVRFDETVRGKDVFLVQSTSYPVNNNLMELLIMIDAAKRASAGRITAVMPYFGYARQDRKARSREPITAKLVANLLTSAGADRILTMDLHCLQIQGFFDIPLDNLVGGPTLYNYFKPKVDEDFVVVSPDIGSVARARKVAARMDAKMAIIDKRRPKANVMEVMNIIGDVKGKNCLMVDDMIDTAGTIVQGAKALKEAGAKEIYACCSHGVLSGPAIERLKDSPITELAMLDTINIPQEKMLPIFKMISTATIFANAIENVYMDRPMSKIYD
ncbi:MAG: ribose-phosphate pyrophosphokinase [Clostridiales bacterium]|nr:ribose-phosphate pyrophosphokinase [Clostridiales bacterium]